MAAETGSGKIDAARTGLVTWQKVNNSNTATQYFSSDIFVLEYIIDEAGVGYLKNAL